MHVGPPGHRYRWIDDWPDLPEEERRDGWAHHTLCVTRDGEIIAFHPVDSRVLVLGPDGDLRRSFDCGVIEGHGATLVEEGAEPYLWIADNGAKMLPTPSSELGYELRRPTSDGSTEPVKAPGVDPSSWRGRVVKVRLDDGELVDELPVPDHPAYVEGSYVPTAVAVAPDGHVWVADGYGASLLHRFSPQGRLVTSISGEESAAGRLQCPHGLLIDHRHGDPELYVADRENLRLVVFGLDGSFRREVARGHLARPCDMATQGPLLAVAELRARVVLLDLHDQVIGEIGGDEQVADLPGWPNAVAAGGILRRPQLAPGSFNSPHGITTDPDGSIYVTEWLIGGRYTRLAPATGDGEC